MLKGTSFLHFHHPFFELDTFYNPERRSQIFFDNENTSPLLAKNQWDEDYCAFCLKNIQLATPEKARIYKNDTTYHEKNFPKISEQQQNILFRHQSNLFEIIPFSFWEQKYSYKAPQKLISQFNEDYADNTMREYLHKLLAHKLQKLNQDLSLTPQQQKDACRTFYLGFHDLICSGSHYHGKAQNQGDLFHSSHFNYLDHRVLVRKICSIIQDMHTNNPFIQFVSVFQNWLYAAGASFEHWHKQILGLDFWGKPLLREAQLYQQNPRCYQDFINSYAQNYDLLIAENQHAMAYIECGGKTGYITICSKSSHRYPFQHSFKEQEAMSDLVHAVLSSLGTHTPYNEQWYYTPFHTEDFFTPWRIILELRSHVSAGFELITQFGINPISPEQLAQELKERIQQNQQNIAPDISICLKKTRYIFHN